MLVLGLLVGCFMLCRRPSQQRSTSLKRLLLVLPWCWASARAGCFPFRCGCKLLCVHLTGVQTEHHDARHDVRTVPRLEVPAAFRLCRSPDPCEVAGGSDSLARTSGSHWAPCARSQDLAHRELVRQAGIRPGGVCRKLKCQIHLKLSFHVLLRLPSRRCPSNWLWRDAPP